MRIPNLLSLVTVCCLTTLSCSQPEESRVYFDNIIDGDSLNSSINIGFGIREYKVGPAGNVGEGMGHHHLLMSRNSIAEGVVIPNNNNHIQLGGGETQTDLNLSPGSYVITLQFADELHKSYGEKMSASVEITKK
ncbi:MAG: rod shape-determining protein RodA [Proteobacteria bacterium]|nr:rod shape-determining protein RodA [Pseudomonadota bacterium]